MQNREETLRYLKAMREGYIEQVGRLDKTIEHLNATIDVIEKEIAVQPPLTPVPGPAIAEFPIGKLRDLTQVQAIVVIAKHQGGTVRAQDAKHLMIRAGVMRDTKNSTNITHNAFIRSGLFERIGPGEFRLKTSSQKKADVDSMFHQPVQ